MNKIEIIGIISSVILFAAMSFPSTSKRNNIIMRILDAVGSLGFVIYGLLIPAWSTAILNFAMIIINIYNIIKLKKSNE